MNILYTNFHREDGGGHTTYILSLLKDSRHNTFVACPPTSMLYKLLEEQRYKNLIPMEFPGKLKHFSQVAKNALKLKRAIVQHKIDIVHTNGSPDNRMAFYAKPLASRKFKIVFTKHNTIKIKNAVSRLRLNKLNAATIFVGDFLEYLGLYKNNPRFHVIPNCIDLEYWRRKTPSSTGSRLTLISNAGASKHKGWHHLMEAIAGLPEAERQRLSVVMLARHEPEMAEELAAAGQICEFRFPGFLTDARSELEKADVGFVLSYKEACSFACREMLAMGLPVITSDFMVLVRNIDESCGWVTKTKDAASIRKVLRVILDMPPERLNAMKLAARRKAEAEFSITDMLEQTDKVYTEIMKK